MGYLSWRFEWRSSHIFGRSFGISLGYPTRSLLDIKWDVTRRDTGDLFRISLDIFRISLDIFRISWEIWVGYSKGYHVENIRRSFYEM